MTPRVVAIIPARGGSKGVPGKNLRRVGGRSLVERAIDACRAARLIDEVYVSTDDGQIAAAAETAGGKVSERYFSESVKQESVNRVERRPVLLVISKNKD